MERILTEYKVIKVAKTRSDNLVDAQIKRKNWRYNNVNQNAGGAKNQDAKVAAVETPYSEAEFWPKTNFGAFQLQKRCI